MGSWRGYVDGGEVMLVVAMMMEMLIMEMVMRVRVAVIMMTPTMYILRLQKL